MLSFNDSNMNLIDDKLTEEAQDHLEKLDLVRNEYTTEAELADEDVFELYENLRESAEDIQDEIRAAHAINEISESASDLPLSLGYVVDDFLSAERNVQSRDFSYEGSQELPLEELEDDLETINEGRRYALDVVDSTKYSDKIRSARDQQELILHRED